MANVTLLGAPTLNTNSGNKSVIATPAVGDLIVLVCIHSGMGVLSAPSDNNSSGTYTQAESQSKNPQSPGDTLQIWIRDSLISAAVSTTFTAPISFSSGGGLVVLKVTGMTKTGSAARRQSAGQSDQAAGSTPSVTLGAALLTGNAVIAAVHSSSNASNTATVPSGWTERYDSSYSTPGNALVIGSLDAGSTLTTVAWAATTPTLFAQALVELDASAGGTTFNQSVGGGLTPMGSVSRAIGRTLGGTV